MAKYRHRTRKKLSPTKKNRIGPWPLGKSINVLPDDVILVIFDFCADEYRESKREIEAWRSLVHVCRRWRSLVFGSSNRLNLELVCSSKTPVRRRLAVWPALPLRIEDTGDLGEGVDNIIAGLERSDCVRVIHLWHVSSSQLEKLSAAMQKPFPELTSLDIRSYGKVVLPDSFLGGSTPCLRYLYLNCISFPGLPKLLWSATHLTYLFLWNVPHCGYISPEAMATSLSKLTRLESLLLEFQSPLSRPDRATRHLHPPTRSVLSVFTRFEFKGDSVYLDELVAHIDAPRLNKLLITFFNDIIFDTPQLIQFICCTPTLKPLDYAHVIFDGGAVTVNLSSLTSSGDLLSVEILCRELDWQLSSVEQVCTWSLPPLSTLEDLYIYEGRSSRAHWQDNIEDVQWLELLHSFGAAKNLYLSEEFARLIGPALQELVGSRATEVLPNLQNIFLVGPLQKGIRQFLSTRQVTGDLIGVFPWNEAGRLFYDSD